MLSAAMRPWPTAVVSRCGRTISPPTKCPLWPGTRKFRSAAMKPLPLSSTASSPRSPVWPIAETIRSQSIANSVPAIGIGRMPSISQRQRRSARARPLASFRTSSGITLPRISTPSCCASCTSRSAAVIFSIGNSEVSTTAAPSRRAALATSCAVWPSTTFSGRSFSCIWVIWPSRRATEATSIDVSPPPTTTTLPDTACSRPSLNAPRNATPVMQLGASAPGTGNGRPLCAPIAQNTASKSLSSSARVTSRPIRVFRRTSTPMATMRPISPSSTSRGVR